MAIAKRVYGQLGVHIARGLDRVVVCIDREQRTTHCAGQLATEVASSLVSVAGQDIARRAHIVVADRTFEAWLLAGAVKLHTKGVFSTLPKRICYEGELCEGNKKRVVELERVLQRPYDKTRDGPKLFAQLDFDEARDHGPGKRGSKSLDKLLRTLGI